MFTPVSIDKFVRIHLKKNPGENENVLRIRIEGQLYVCLALKTSLMTGMKIYYVKLMGQIRETRKNSNVMNMRNYNFKLSQIEIPFDYEHYTHSKGR